jgi:transcriptional regulator NrdR family protein
MTTCPQCHNRTLLIASVRLTADGIRCDFVCVSCAYGYTTLNGKKLTAPMRKKQYQRDKRAAFARIMGVKP